MKVNAYIDRCLNYTEVTKGDLSVRFHFDNFGCQAQIKENGIITNVQSFIGDVKTLTIKQMCDYVDRLKPLK